MITAINSNLNFLGNRRLPELEVNTVKHLVRQMNKETKPQKIEGVFSSTLISHLKTSLGHFNPLSSLRMKGAINKKGEVAIKLNKPPIYLRVKMDNGEIVEFKKPWYVSWTKTFQKAGEFLNDLKMNFNNPEKVKKEFVTKSLQSLSRAFKRNHQSI